MISYLKKGVALFLIFIVFLIIVFRENIYQEAHFQYKSFIYKKNSSKKLSSHLKLSINHKEYKKIQKKRNKALINGYLIKGKSDYVSANLKLKDKKINSKIRLKGDHIDHLKTNMWSFRIKLKDTTLFGYEKFSIQSPKTRGYMCEWVFHKLLKHEGIIYLDYFFVPVSINGKHKGIYAFEGHFNNSILLKSNRPLGPILKFNEDKMWLEIFNKKTINDTLLFREAKIDIYNKKWGKEYKSKNKKAKKLLLEYQNQKLPADSIFDLNLWAKYIAIGKTLGSAHHLRWHNLRFYYNPKTTKIEPVGFDMSSWFNVNHWPYEGSFEPFYDFFYKDKKFNRLLSNHLKRINNELYFEQFLESVNTELEFESKMIGEKDIKNSIIKYIRWNNEQ